ncbi:hypothetical protein [Microbacterium maritypicum]
MKMEKPLLSIYEKAVQTAMRRAARQVLASAKERSPTLTGESDDSGFVATDDLTVQVGFTSLVSRLNHENLDYKHPQGGEPKFLETASDEVDMEAIAAEELRKGLGS